MWRRELLHHPALLHPCRHPDAPLSCCSECSSTHQRPVLLCTLHPPLHFLGASLCSASSISPLLLSIFPPVYYHNVSTYKSLSLSTSCNSPCSCLYALSSFFLTVVSLGCFPFFSHSHSVTCFHPISSRPLSSDSGAVGSGGSFLLPPYLISQQHLTQTCHQPPCWDTFFSVLLL